MANGNGVDLGTIVGMLGEVIRTQAELVKGQANLEKGLANLEKGQASLEKGQADLKRELKGDIADLRRELMTYHASVMGHGMLITELQERMKRAEDHLGLPSIGSH